MSKEEKRIKIAKACGAQWIWAYSGKYGCAGPLRELVLTFKRSGELARPSCVDYLLNEEEKQDIDEALAEIPDYLNDLNAIQKAVLSQDQKVQAEFNNWFIYRPYWPHEATAEQWCEGLLRSLNLWKP